MILINSLSLNYIIKVLLFFFYVSYERRYFDGSPYTAIFIYWASRATSCVMRRAQSTERRPLFRSIVTNIQYVVRKIYAKYYVQCISNF